MEAFAKLGTTRQIGMSMGPIPWHRIVQYGDRMGLEAGECDALVEIIGVMDKAWLDRQQKKPENDG